MPRNGQNDGVSGLRAGRRGRSPSNRFPALGPEGEGHARGTAVREEQLERPGAPQHPAAASFEIAGETLVERGPAAAQEHETRVGPAGQEGFAIHVVEEDRRGAGRNLIQYGEGQRVPEESARLVGLPRAPEVLREGDAFGRAAEADREAEAKSVELHPPRHPEAEDADEEMKGRWERRTVQGRRPARVDIVQSEVRLFQEQVSSPGSPDQVQGLGIGPDHDVGAVVDLVAGGRVAVRRRSAAQDPASLEEDDFMTALLERDGRREAGEPAPDHDDPHLATATRSAVAAAIHALRARDRVTRRPRGNRSATTLSSTVR